MTQDSKPQGTVQIALRISPDLRERVKVAADANNRSVNSELTATLEEKYPSPREDMELSTLAAWLDYVRKGGPEDEFDDRLHEVNDRLDRHPATRHLRLALLVRGSGDEMEVDLYLVRTDFVRTDFHKAPPFLAPLPLRLNMWYP